MLVITRFMIVSSLNVKSLTRLLVTNNSYSVIFKSVWITLDMAWSIFSNEDISLSK